MYIYLWVILLFALFFLLLFQNFTNLYVRVAFPNLLHVLYMSGIGSIKIKSIVLELLINSTFL